MPGSSTSTVLSQSQIADALALVARQMTQGVPAAAVYVSEHGITILANPIGAARWRELHGETLGGHPLYVTAVHTLSVVSS